MLRIAYLFTSFPKLSEQFFLREVLELRAQGVQVDVYSMWRGGVDSSSGVVTHMLFLDWLRVLPELFYWLCIRPLVICQIFCLLCRRYGSWTNCGENILGLLFAVRFARSIRAKHYDYTHACWATAPGMAAYVLRRLTEQKYTLEAHAYDVFRDGGDTLLKDKLTAAQAVRSSTDSTAQVLHILKGAREHPKIQTIRRGLGKIPVYQERLAQKGALHVLSVGRLIEKKGYSQELEIFSAWQRQGIDFRATIIGEGPMHRLLLAKIKELGLEDRVTLIGKLPYSEVETYYKSADLFLFTGSISKSGDRDGFPNVIAEAMSYSLPVFSTAVAGTTEVIRHGETGYIVDLQDVDLAAAAIYEQMQMPESILTATRNAHQWVRDFFNVSTNIKQLSDALWCENTHDQGQG